MADEITMSRYSHDLSSAGTTILARAELAGRAVFVACDATILNDYYPHEDQTPAIAIAAAHRDELEALARRALAAGRTLEHPNEADGHTPKTRVLRLVRADFI